ncbi:MAG: DUF4145 domain-containing protein [Methylocystis sp.]|nr:DUF4145 domain-containing protein [Methylocystis sp.]
MQAKVKRRRELKETKAPCSSCLQVTTHKVLFETSTTDEDWDQAQFTESFSLLQCAGCQHISMKHSLKYLDDRSAQNHYYPPPTSRKKPAWWLYFGMAENEKPLSDLLWEIYQTVEGGQHRLAAMGVRALLEQIMILKIGDQGTFTGNLDALQRAGYISTVQHDTMRNILDVGDAAIHRGFKPKEEELNLVLDIMEAIIGTIFHHSEESGKLLNRVPPRARQPKKTKKT